MLSLRSKDHSSLGSYYYYYFPFIDGNVVSQGSNLFKAPKLVMVQAEMQAQAEEMNYEGRICVLLIHHLYFSEVLILIKLEPGSIF